MKTKWIFPTMALFLLIACQQSAKTDEPSQVVTENPFQLAGKMVREMKCDSSLALLKQAFKRDQAKPMQIITDSDFYPLVDQADCRAKVRALLKEFAVEHSATMVRPEEAGKPMVVKGKILDETDHTPLENVLVELVHADNEGLYFAEKSMWNPRLFAYLLTDENGEFEVQTIRPGTYQDDEGVEVPVHIHFTLEAEGYRSYGSEFTFEDDPVFRANGNVEQVPVAEANENGYEVTIYLQPE